MSLCIAPPFHRVCVPDARGYYAGSRSGDLLAPDWREEYQRFFKPEQSDFLATHFNSHAWQRAAQAQYALPLMYPRLVLVSNAAVKLVFRQHAHFLLELRNDGGKFARRVL